MTNIEPKISQKKQKGAVRHVCTLEKGRVGLQAHHFGLQSETKAEFDLMVVRWMQSYWCLSYHFPLCYISLSRYIFFLLCCFSLSSTFEILPCRMHSLSALLCTLFLFGFDSLHVSLATKSLSYSGPCRQRLAHSGVRGDQEGGWCPWGLPVPWGLCLHQYPRWPFPERPWGSTAPVPLWALPYHGCHCGESSVIFKRKQIDKKSLRISFNVQVG